MSEFRLSLFSLKLGESAFYFFSLKQKKFHLYSEISIPNLLKFEDYNEIDSAYKDFKEKVDKIESSDKVNLLAEFYNNQITKFENGFSQAFNKCLSYIALIAFIAPFFLSFIITQNLNLKSLIFLLVIFFYLLINIFILVMKFIKVKNYKFLVESEIHKYNDMDRTRAYINFHTFKVLNKKSNYHISIIKNIEKYIKLFAILTFGSWIIIFFHQQIKDNNELNLLEDKKIVSESYIYQKLNLIDNPEYGFTVNNKQELMKLDYDKVFSAKEIIIFYSNKTNKNLKENIESYLKLTLSSKTVVILIEDSELDEGQFKILIKGDK